MSDLLIDTDHGVDPSIVTPGSRAHRVLARVEWGIRLGWFGPVSEEKKAQMAKRVFERWSSEREDELMALVADRRLQAEFGESMADFKRRKTMSKMWKTAGWTKPAEATSNVQRGVVLDMIRVEVRSGNLEISSPVQHVHALISFEAFEQLARVLDAPPDYLRTLGPTLVAQNLNHRLKGAVGMVDLSTVVDGAVVVLSKVESAKGGRA